MFIYFSSGKNMHIFDEEAKELGIDVQIEQERSLADYLDKNLNSLLNYLEFLAIDVDYIVDKDTEIIKKLSSLKTFKPSVTIIIVAFERIKGDILLGKLFASGIYNFITSKDNMLSEIKICLDHNKNNSNNYPNAIGFQVNFLEEKMPNKKGFLGNFIDNLKNKDKKEKILEKELKRKSKSKDKSKLKKVKFEEKNDFEKEIMVEENAVNDFLEEYESNNKNVGYDKNIEEPKNDNKEQAIVDTDEKVSNLFNKSSENRFTKEKRRKRLEIDNLKEGVDLFYYYQKPVGIIYNNVCIIDNIFEKDDIKKFFESKKDINLKFEDSILKDLEDIINGK